MRGHAILKALTHTSCFVTCGNTYVIRLFKKECLRIPGRQTVVNLCKKRLHDYVIRYLRF